jgi:hypothetical protein
VVDEAPGPTLLAHRASEDKGHENVQRAAKSKRDSFGLVQQHWLFGPPARLRSPSSSLQIGFELGAKLDRTKQRTWRQTDYWFGRTANFRTKGGAKSEAKKSRIGRSKSSNSIAVLIDCHIQFMRFGALPFRIELPFFLI